VAALILFGLIGLLAASHAPGQQGPDGGKFAIVVDVDLVVFNVTVTDDRGRPVSGLKASDFRIREDSRLQDIKLFSAEDVPASIGLVIDNSGSMRDRGALVARVALEFAGSGNPEDELFVVSFNEKVSLSLPPSIAFTDDLDQIRSALRSSPDGLTALYDALAVGIEHLKTGTRDRKALVVLSDGADNASRRRLDDVLQIAQRSSATIYTIGLYDENSPDRNPRVLRRIAELTGGRAYFPRSSDDLERAWRDIAREIRSQYTIGYRSSNPNRDGVFRKVEITAIRNVSRSLRVIARDGYFAPGDRSIAR
jgi:Ca-activated chloride channel homolog